MSYLFTHRSFFPALALFASVVLIGAGCSAQPENTNAIVDSDSTVDVADTTAAVPAPGFEGTVDEMVVNTNATSDTVVEEEEPEVTPVPASNTNNTPASNTPETTPAVDPAPAKKEFTITAKQWAFSPATVTVNTGDVVTLHIKSTDVAHGFFLAEFGVNETLKPGATTDVTFTASKSGSYTFSCNLFCGSGHNDMSGMLIVQ